MAAADYRLCDVCRGKAFYDATLNYDFTEYPDTGLGRLGDWVVLCRDCAKTHETKIVERDPKPASSAEETSELMSAPIGERWMQIAAAGRRLKDKETSR